MRRLLISLLAIPAFAVIAAGCSSSAGTSASSAPAAAASSAPTSAPSSAAASSPAPASSAAPSSASSSGLSGKWSGKYSGAFSGTFNLTWQQSGSSLSGMITLSAPAATVPLNGTVKGNTISFGTVGSVAVTYSGTFSGSSMSGSYTVGGQSGGSWSATKSS
jgi:hypothetical protein